MIDLKIDDFKRKKDFLVYEMKNITIAFSTAESDRSFNRNTDYGIKNLNTIKEDFNLKDVVYLNQIHSDKVYKYDKEFLDINDKEGDAIVTDEKDTAIGVFTADCVPIIIANDNCKVVATIHSGWRGTYESIVLCALDKMREDFNIDIKDTKVFIGPHIKKCCYEVSEELKDKFIQRTKLTKDKIFNGMNLSLEACILNDLINYGVREENIYSLNLCTHCTDDLKLYSYRKSVGTYGRLFSFAFIK